MDHETETVMEGPLGGALARFATASSAETMPESARQVMRLSLFDWIAVSRAGMNEPVGRIVREMVAGEGGTPQAGIFGHDALLPARAAALANGAISHALDYDDTHFAYVGHPSVAVIPAALAIAEKAGASGAAFLDAALIGVEAACRVGIWLGRAHYQLGFHQTATAGSFGATLAACRLLGVSGEQARQALGIASTRASGLKSQFGTMGKPFNAGIAAANGVEAAQLAAAGFVSRPDGLECAQGFGETHGGEMPPVDQVLGGLGTSFLFEAVQHKFHACCHGLHAALEAVAAAREAHRLVPADVVSLTLAVNPRWPKVCNIAQPTTGLQAKFSYRLTAAMALAGKDTGALSTYSDANCQDGALTDLRDRVSVMSDDTLSDTQTRLVITSRSGEVLEGGHDLSRPMPIGIREARVKAKVTALLGQGAADRLWQSVVSLADSKAGMNEIGLTREIS